MDTLTLKKAAETYKRHETRRRFLRYLKNVHTIIQKNSNYGAALNKYSNAIRDRHMPDVKKAREEVLLLRDAYYTYGRVADTNINFNNDTRIFYQVRNLTAQLQRVKELRDRAKKRGVRVTKNVNGKRVYKTEKELEQNLR